MFLDGTSLSVGPNAQLTIDKFVYDPATKTGDLAINASKGVFRLVGGKITFVHQRLWPALVRAAGLASVMDRCVKIEYARLFGGLNYAGVNTRIISAKRPPCPPLQG